MNPSTPKPDPEVEALLQEHLSGLRSFVRVRTGPMLRSMESSSDLVQSVCREVLQHRERFHAGGEEGFRRWLYTSALRKIANRADYYRAAKRNPGARVPLGEDGTADAGLLACYGTVCTPSRILREREEVERIEAAFDRLSEGDREIISLARLARLSHAQIAEELELTEGAVRMRLYRALERLSAILASPDDG